MKVLVLGSGIATGVPAWNDGSETALRARVRDPDVPQRRGAALAVSPDGVRYSLVEAPLHLPATLAGSARFAPLAGRRAAPIDSLLVTSAELDACAGLLGLRAGLSSRIFSPLGVRDALHEHDAAFAHLAPLWSGLPWDRAISLDREERLEARFFPLPGPMPDHLRECGARAGRARAGLRITDRKTGTRLVWAPRIARLDSATLAELRAADLRFVDGTCHAEEEGRRLRPGAAGASALGHLAIDGREGSLAWLSGMSGRTLYVHLAATNPLCVQSSKEGARVREAGIEIASDGQEIEA